MPRPIITDYRGALLSGYFAPPGTPAQTIAVETILKSRPQLPNWIEILDLAKCGTTPQKISDTVRNRGYSCVAIPVLDETQFHWAEQLSGMIKNAGEEIRTLAIVLGDSERMTSAIQSSRELDAAVHLDPILLTVTPLAQQDSAYPEWRLAAATLIDTLMRVFAREPLSEIDGIVYRNHDGAICQRPKYSPHLFGDLYYGEWEEQTAVGARDLAAASEQAASLVYGELTETAGVRLLSNDYCDGSRATTLFDLGMGTGRLALQAFANYPSLQHVTGVELSADRYCVAATAAKKFAQIHGFACAEYPDRIKVFDRSKTESRDLEFVCGDLFQIPMGDLQRAQIVLIMTEIPQSEQLDTLVNGLKPNTRVATNLDLSKRPSVKVEAIPKGRRWKDGFATSFSPNYYYYVWRRPN